MSGDLVILVFAALGIAASAYGLYVYWRNNVRLVAGPEPLVSES